MFDDNLLFDKTLVFEENFKDFNDFYERTKEKIYNDVVDLFESIITKEKKEFNISLSGNINDIFFKSHINYGMSDIHLLNDVILPYFVEKEEYEKCEKISIIYNKLKSIR